MEAWSEPLPTGQLLERQQPLRRARVDRLANSRRMEACAEIIYLVITIEPPARDLGEA